MVISVTVCGGGAPGGGFKFLPLHISILLLVRVSQNKCLPLTRKYYLPPTGNSNSNMTPLIDTDEPMACYVFVNENGERVNTRTGQIAEWLLFITDPVKILL